MRTLLFGLDGATYTVLDHYVRKGSMPNLAKFYGRGTRATLLSTPHPLTPQAWTTLATGRSAGHHGVHDFLRRESNAQGIFWRVNDARDIHCETIWEYASRMGKRVTMLNYYGTAPPRLIHGHSIPAFVPGRHLRRSSHPADLFDKLQGIDGFDPKLMGLDADMEVEALQDMEPGRWCQWLRHHVARERVWFGVLEHLMTHEPSDLTAIVFDGVDRIQHLAYRFLDPELAPKNPNPWESEVLAVCEEYFRQIDSFLGRALTLTGPWGRVFIASDHGFTSSADVVYINKWLADQGFLRWRNEAVADEKHAIYELKMSDLTNAIDLERTKAYALTPSCIGLFVTVPLAEYEAFRDELAKALLTIQGSNGEPIVAEVVRREDLFSGPFLERIPDLTIRFRNHACISVLNARETVAARKDAVGTHHPDGVLLGVGPGLLEGKNAGRLNILDVAPLLLHSIGLEIPDEFEGTFPRSFYQDAYLESDPPRVGQGVAAKLVEDVPGSTNESGFQDDEDEAVVLDRLKQLGYIE